MKQPSVYLKMRVLGALDTVEGRTRHERVHHAYGGSVTQSVSFEYQVENKFVYIVDHSADATQGGKGHLHIAVPKSGSRLAPGDTSRNLGANTPTEHIVYE